MTAKRWLILVGGIVVIAAVAASIAVAWVAPRLRADLERALAERLDSVVTIETLDVRLFPRPSFTGHDLVIRHRGRTDLPPLIVVGRFSGHASWSGVFSQHLSNVRLDGLEITIPPRRRADMPSFNAQGQSEPDAGEGADDDTGSKTPFAIDSLVAVNTRLSIMPRRADKDPRVFDIFSLEIQDLTFETPSTFVASLTNPVPEGQIDTEGSFGPWDREEPSDTPVEGRYTFAADLGTIKGIAGTLDSDGEYGGAINRIVATGATRTPDFRIPKLKAAALPLTTTYRAVVDGTNGDVQLEQVEAQLAGSRFLATGSVVGTKGIPGKRVQLEVTSDDARMEDMLRLTVRTSPPAMTGAATLKTSVDLPQGDRDVVDKLKLAGQVQIRNARFASDTVQDKVDDLSRRGQGRPKDQSIDDVASQITARFSMADGSLTVRNIQYVVRGARISMEGRYALESGALDFTGTVRLNASASDTQTGFRHFLLKPFDPLLRKDGAGTRLALKVSGTVDEPKFGVDIGRTLKGK